MATEKRVVIPDDMGKTIELGHKEPDKWNVKHDGTLQTLADGSLSVVPAGCTHITDLNTLAGLPSGDGTFCIYGIHNADSKVPGMVTNMNAKDETQPRWESGDTTADFDWNGWVTRAGNQTTVYVNGGSTTWSSVNDDAAGAVNGWSEWRRVENVAPPKTSQGLDCNAIQQLPQKPWKQGTSVLGQQDGKCVRLVPTESLFQEIGVALAANKLSGNVGDTYHVIATVTNVGAATNDVTDLTITKPALGSYAVSNFSTSASAGASVERVSDYVYKVKKLGSGGTAKVEFDVVANAGGTFQFGVAVNPNTALDMQSNNNQATITLSARIQQNPDITPSADCPVVELTIDGIGLVSHSRSERYIEPDNARVKTLLMNKPSLNGLVVKVKQDVTVVIQVATMAMLYNSLRISDGRFLKSTASVKAFVEPTDTAASTFTNYQYANKTITFGQGITQDTARISVRPKGVNCKWQHFDILTAGTLVTPTKTLTLQTTLPHTKTTAFNKTKRDDRDSELARITATMQVIGGTATPLEYYTNGDRELFAQEYLTINLPAGRTTVGTISGTGIDLTELNTAGNIKAVWNATTQKVDVTTTAQVSAADGFTYKNITFKVV